MIICPKCQYDNELGRIFCHSCGTKLDLARIKPPSEGAKIRRKIKRGASRTVRMLIEVAITGVLVVCIWLMCLTPEVKSTPPTVAEADVAEKKREDLETLVEGDTGGKIEAKEAELNSYLTANGFVKDKPGEGFQVSPVALHATLEDGAVKVEFRGTIHFGSTFDKGLYLGYEGVPALENGQFVFRPTGGWLGKLPIHPWLLKNTGLFDNYMGRLLVNLTADRQLIEKLSSITVTHEAVEFVKDGPPAPVKPGAPANPASPKAAGPKASSAESVAHRVIAQ
jgi:hypothetical protein